MLIEVEVLLVLVLEVDVLCDVLVELVDVLVEIEVLADVEVD